MSTQSEFLHTGMDLFSVQRTAGPLLGFYRDCGAFHMFVQF